DHRHGDMDVPIGPCVKDEDRQSQPRDEIELLHFGDAVKGFSKTPAHSIQDPHFSSALGTVASPAFHARILRVSGSNRYRQSSTRMAVNGMTSEALGGASEGSFARNRGW